MKVKILCFLFVCLFSISQSVFPLQETEEGRKYLEAVINLKSIEKHFTGEPIYLSKDVKLKTFLKDKISKIIGYIQEYYDS